jgi:hypothetical protein
VNLALQITLGLQDLSSAIFAGLEVDVVWPPALAGVFILHMHWRYQRVSRPSRSAFHARYFLPGYGHRFLTPLLYR